MQHKVICMGAHASPAKYQQLWTVLPWTGLQVSIKALDCIWWYSGRRGVKKELCATNYQWLLPCWNLVLKAARQGGLDSSPPTFKHIPISTPLSLNITVFIFLFICRTEEENREEECTTYPQICDKTNSFPLIRPLTTLRPKQGRVRKRMNNWLVVF